MNQLSPNISNCPSAVLHLHAGETTNRCSALDASGSSGSQAADKPGWWKMDRGGHWRSGSHAQQQPGKHLTQLILAILGVFMRSAGVEQRHLADLGRARRRVNFLYTGISNHRG
jgi:hypothetical protein